MGAVQTRPLSISRHTMITARDVIRRAFRLTGDRNRDLNDDDEALDDLNESLRDLSTRSESIVYGQYYSAVKNQGRYGLDPQFLGVKFIGFKPQDGYFYPLTPGNVKDATVVNQNRQTGYSPYYDPCTYDISGRSQEEKVVSRVITVNSQTAFTIANPPSSLKVGDRVFNVTNDNAQATISLLSDTGIEVDEWRGQAYPAISAGDTLRILSSDRATDRGTTTIELLYSPVNFRLASIPTGLTDGDIIINETRDGVETTLEGFVEADPDLPQDLRRAYVEPWGGIKAGDEIRILGLSRETQSLVIAPAPSFDDVPGTESIYVYAAYQHRKIESSHIQSGNDTLDIDVELENALVFMTAYYMAVAEHGIDSPMADRLEARYERSFHQNMPSVNNRIEEYRSMWFGGAYPRYQERLLNERSQTENSQNTVNR